MFIKGIWMDGKHMIITIGTDQKSLLKHTKIWTINIKQGSAAQQAQEIINKAEHRQGRPVIDRLTVALHHDLHLVHQQAALLHHVQAVEEISTGVVDDKIN